MMQTDTILGILLECADGGFQLHEGYVEPGYSDPESGLIATGNWNSHERSERVWPINTPDWLEFPDKDVKDKLRRVTDNTMPRIAAILEKLGVELEWEDEWCACSECYKIFRTQPDCYSWTASYWHDDGCGIYCKDCVLDDPEDYLEYLEGNPRAANTLDLDLESQGYRHIDKEYENGWYGIEDNPQEIAEGLRKLGIKRFIFEVDSVGQFNVSFSVWVHELEYHKLNPEDTTTIKLISKQDFIEGKVQ